MTAYTGRRYDFRVHGWSNFDWIRKATESTAQRAKKILTLESITLDDVIYHERMLEAFKELRREGGPAPGVDRLRAADFGPSEIAAVLRDVTRGIREGTYRPQRARCVPIPKPNGGRRVLRIRTVADRTVGKAVTIPLTPLIDPLFCETSFGFRPGRSHLQMLATLEARMIATDSWVLAADDIRRAFDFVPIDEAVSIYRNLLHDRALVELIEVVLRGHEGALRERGIDQGCPSHRLL